MKTNLVSIDRTHRAGCELTFRRGALAVEPWHAPGYFVLAPPGRQTEPSRDAGRLAGIFHTRGAGALAGCRMAGETDLGGAVVFLLGDAARYITGANLPVDGGYTAK